VQFQFPIGWYGQLAPLHGWLRAAGVLVATGIIDGDYTGEIMVMMFNHGIDEIVIHKGEQIAQMLCNRMCFISEMKLLNEDNNQHPQTKRTRRQDGLATLDTWLSERGNGGFGSSGQ
jgi:dUTPase